MLHDGYGLHLFPWNASPWWWWHAGLDSGEQATDEDLNQLMQLLQGRPQ